MGDKPPINAMIVNNCLSGYIDDGLRRGRQLAGRRVGYCFAGRDPVQQIVQIIDRFGFESGDRFLHLRRRPPAPGLIIYVSARYLESLVDFAHRENDLQTLNPHSRKFYFPVPSTYPQLFETPGARLAELPSAAPLPSPRAIQRSLFRSSWRSSWRAHRR